MATKIGKKSYTQLMGWFLGIFLLLLLVIIGYISGKYGNSIFLNLVFILVGLLIACIAGGLYISTQKVLQKMELLKKNQNHIFHQLESSQQLFQYIQPRLPLPNTRNWVASPDFLLVLFEKIMLHKPKHIVELGSGVSTLYLSYLIEKQQLHTQIISIDHDETYAEKTRALLKEHGLESMAKVIFSPLGKDAWYALSESPVESIDMLIVDGPPTVPNSEARNKALPFFYSHLNANALIIVDDADRNEGVEMLRFWTEKFPEIHILQFVYTEKGTAILRKNL